MSEIKKLSDALVKAVEKGGGYTVTVVARRRFPASGIAIGKDLVLTASHVVRRDENISVILPDGKKVKATIAGRDHGSDLVVLKLEEEVLTPAKVNGDVKVGQMVLALGRPSTGGIEASQGIISALHGPMLTRRGGSLGAFLRTDAIPFPGFSGGPLVDLEGKLVGINTSGLGHGFGNSVAVPAAEALKIAEQLEKHGTLKRGYLGVRSELVDLPEKAEALGREQKTGLLLVGLEEDSGAESAELMVGDILIGINGEAISNHEDLFAILVGDIVGQKAKLDILRGGKVAQVEVTVGERTESMRGKMIGRHGGRKAFMRKHGRGKHALKHARKSQRKMHRGMRRHGGQRFDKPWVEDEEPMEDKD